MKCDSSSAMCKMRQENWWIESELHFIRLEGGWERGGGGRERERERERERRGGWGEVKRIGQLTRKARSCSGYPYYKA